MDHGDAERQPRDRGWGTGGQHAGTLSGNPLAMTAGLKTMEILRRPGSYEHLDKITKRLIEGIIAEGKAAGHAICGGHISGMFGFFFTDGPVTCFEDAAKDGFDGTGAPLEAGVYATRIQLHVYAT